MRNKIWLLVSTCILVACTSKLLVHRYEHTRPEGWVRSDTIRFEIPEVPATAHYLISAGLRIDNKFPYQDLWIIMETRLEEPHLILHDTIDYAVTDEKGIPLGDGINKRQQERPVRSLTLHKGQHGEVRFYHIMTREEVPGITDVGLTLEAISPSVNTQKYK